MQRRMLLREMLLLLPLLLLALLLLLLPLLRRQGRQMSVSGPWMSTIATRLLKMAEAAWANSQRGDTRPTCTYFCLCSFWWVACCTTPALFCSNRTVPDAASSGIPGHTPVFKVSQRPGMCIHVHLNIISRD